MANAPINQTNLGMAALTACIVQALDDTQGGVRQRFEENLQTVCQVLTDRQMITPDGLEILRLTRDLLKQLG